MWPGKRELLEEFLQSLGIFALVGIDLGIGALEVRRAEHARRAVAGTRHEDHIEVVALDDAIQVRPDERQRGARAPMPEQPMLDMLDVERLAQQGVVPQIDHADAKIVAGAPPCVDAPQFFCAQWAGRDASLGFCGGCHW